MWEIIEQNKKKSSLIFFLMNVVFVLTGIFYGLFITSALVLFYLYIFEGKAQISLSGLLGLYIASSIISFVAILFLAKQKTKNEGEAILEELGAISVPKDKYLHNIVEEMAIASGLKGKPAIYILDSDEANAFAMGYSQNKAKIVVTSKLITMLDRNELQGVIAHEMAHIKNFDCRLMTRAYIMLYFIFLLSGRFFSTQTSGRGGNYYHSRRISSSSGGGKGGGAVALIALAVLIISAIYVYIIAPIFIACLCSMLSKKREFLADGCAVQYTRYPSGLMGALEKLSKAQRGVSLNQSEEKDISKMSLLNTLFIVPKFGGQVQTHPPTADRIKILSKMAGSGLGDYNDAYKQSFKKDIIKSKMELKNQDIIQNITGAVVAASAIEAQNVEMSKLEKHRAVGEFFEEKAGFIQINCQCDTKLKIPNEYLGQKVLCPHCNKEHTALRSEENEMSKVQ